MTAKSKILADALLKSWSANSSTKWKPDNPALGQCGVTAAVVQEHLGGEILKTWVQKPGGIALWHFYNRIDGHPMDFTHSQFDEEIAYDDVPSTREAALSDGTASQYDHLSTTVRKNMDHNFDAS